MLSRCGSSFWRFEPTTWRHISDNLNLQYPHCVNIISRITIFTFLLYKLVEGWSRRGLNILAWKFVCVCVHAI